MKRLKEVLEILLAQMRRLDRQAPRISSARKLVPFLARPNETSDILAVVRRPQLRGGAGPEPSHKSLAGHPPPREREWGTSSGFRCIGLLVTLFSVVYLLSGCGIIMIGEPVKEQNISAEDDAEENLKAIRAMLADQARRGEEKNESPQPSLSDTAPAPGDPHSNLRPAASPSSSAGRIEAPAKLPWTPTSPDRPTAPDRPVPAYTVPAPVGPDYSGSIRCSPDGMGGQRCVGR